MLPATVWTTKNNKEVKNDRERYILSTIYRPKRGKKNAIVFCTGTEFLFSWVELQCILVLCIMFTHAYICIHVDMCYRFIRMYAVIYTFYFRSVMLSLETKTRIKREKMRVNSELSSFLFCLWGTFDIINTPDLANKLWFPLYLLFFLLYFLALRLPTCLCNWRFVHLFCVPDVSRRLSFHIRQTLRQYK